MYSEAQKRASINYKKKNIKRIELNLNRDTDADVIDYLEQTENTQGEVKRLIRARIQKQIFTNKQTNLMRSTINARIIELENWIDEAREVMAGCEATKAKTPIEDVQKRMSMRINKYQSDIKRWADEVEELRDLRSYIEGAYYG